MSNAKPYMTTDDLIASIKRRISFPLSQNTFQYSDIVAFLNEEMQLSAVPSVKMEHEEYFVYKHTVELVNGVSRYEIPSRAIGMAVRDIKYSDSSGNFYDMTRIAPDDKAFFQQSNGSNQTISKYYLEGNEIVLTPLVQSGVSGKLNFFIFLRPNSLVRNDRAAIIQHYEKNITISNNSNLEIGDTVTLTTRLNTSDPISYTFTAVNVPPSIYSIDASSVLTTNSAHGLIIGNTYDVIFSGVSNITPDINGPQNKKITALTSNTLKIEDTAISLDNPTYTFTITAASVTEGAVYKDINNNTYIVKNSSTGTTLIVTGSVDPVAGPGTLIKVSGTGANTITYSAYTSSSYNKFLFTLNPVANATAGDVYSNANNEIFTVVNTIASGNSLLTSGTVNTLSSGVLTRVSGTGDSTITFTSVKELVTTGGSYSYSVNNQFLIGASANATANTLKTAITTASLPNIIASVTGTNAFVNVTYYEISNAFSSGKVTNAINPSGITIDNENVSISFNKTLSSTYTDPETMQQSDFYEVGSYVDFLQTNPGHRTYVYDVPVVSISGSVASFPAAKLQTYLNNSSGGALSFYNIKIGDYICLANECIIPQIPPELHNALAERAASRILMAIGDVQGYQVSQAKLAEMNKYQETLIGSRVEGSVPKVFNRYSLLRLGKSRFRRRY